MFIKKEDIMKSHDTTEDDSKKPVSKKRKTEDKPKPNKRKNTGRNIKLNENISSMIKDDEEVSKDQIFNYALKSPKIRLPEIIISVDEKADYCNCKQRRLGLDNKEKKELIKANGNEKYPEINKSINFDNNQDIDQAVIKKKLKSDIYKQKASNGRRKGVIKKYKGDVSIEDKNLLDECRETTSCLVSDDSEVEMSSIGINEDAVISTSEKKTGLKKGGSTKKVDSLVDAGENLSGHKINESFKNSQPNNKKIIKSATKNPVKSATKKSGKSATKKAAKTDIKKAANCATKNNIKIDTKIITISNIEEISKINIEKIPKNNTKPSKLVDKYAIKCEYTGDYYYPTPYGKYYPASLRDTIIQTEPTIEPEIKNPIQKNLTDNDKKALVLEFLKRNYRWTVDNMRYVAKEMDLPRNKSIDYLRDYFDNIYEQSEKAFGELTSLMNTADNLLREMCGMYKKITKERK